MHKPIVSSPRLRALALLIAFASAATPLFTNCSGGGASGSPSDEVTGASARRSYRMGFTTFPSSVSQAGVDFPLAKIATDADMISFHIEGGVPWADAAVDVLSDPLASRYNSSLVGDWNTKKNAIPAGHKVFVSVNSLNMARNGLTLSWTAAGFNQPVAPWNGYAFDDSRVKQAYLNYCKRAIDFFRPDYFAFGIEINLLSTNSPGQWAAYMNLHRHVYQALKTAYPSLPIFVTQTAVNLLSGYDANTTPSSAFADLMAYSDWFAISVYPYLSAYMTSSIPSDLFDRLKTMSSKPIAIAEGGYPAQTFSIAGPLTFASDQTKQDEFVRLLLAAGDKYRFNFINLYLVRDYDDSLGTSDELTIFKYIGMYDGSGSPRLARARWMRRLAVRPAN